MKAAVDRGETDQGCAREEITVGNAWKQGDTAESA